MVELFRIPVQLRLQKMPEISGPRHATDLARLQEAGTLSWVVPYHRDDLDVGRPIVVESVEKNGLRSSLDMILEKEYIAHEPPWVLISDGTNFSSHHIVLPAELFFECCGIQSVIGEIKVDELDLIMLPLKKFLRVRKNGP